MSLKLVKEIKLTRGKKTIIDREDFSKVRDITWKYSNRGYAASNYYDSGKYKTRLMHRLIINAPEGMFVDHIDGDPLNNRKQNLRLVSNKQNTWNQEIGARNTSGYKGVSLKKQTNRYQAQITKKGKKYYLGYFDDPKEAAYMYDFWAVDLFGEYARLNDIDGKRRIVVARG